MSDQVEEKLVGLLPNLATGPYGNPIPGLDKLGVDAPQPAPVMSLAAACGRTGAEVDIVWFAEPLQVDHYLLEKFRQTGVMPGARVVSRPEGDYITLSAPDVEDVLDLPVETATHVFVRTVPKN